MATPKSTESDRNETDSGQNPPKLDNDAADSAELSTGSSDKKQASKTSSHHRGLKAWWGGLSKKQKIAIITAKVVVLAALVIGLTPLRYPVVGVFHKGQINLTVVDDSTHQAIAGAEVSVGGALVTSDTHGNVKLTGLSLGKTTISMSKHAYETKTASTTVFWSTVNLGLVQLHSTGVLSRFSVTDWVTGKPLPSVTVTIAKATAVTDASGTTSVSLDPQAVAGAKATISADGYNSVTTPINQAVGKVNAVTLVPAGNVYFFSNRTGKRIDLYSSSLDGSGQTSVLNGSGNEDTQTGLLPSITAPDTMAIVSSRAGHHNSNGNLEHDLYIFDGTAKKLTQIDSNIEFTDFRAWSSTTLVYFKNETAGGFSIKSYNTKTSTAKTLLTVAAPSTPNPYANASGLGVVGNNLYYNVNSSDPNATGFYSITLAGVPTRLDPGNVGQTYRQAKSSLIVSLDNGTSTTWKQLNFNNQSFTTLAGEPTSQASRGYADSPDGQHSVFVETRDGKSQLYVTDGSGNNEQVVTTSGDVNQFVQWYNNRYVAYSTNANNSSTIYIASIAGGPEKKVADFFQGNGRTYGGGYNPNYF